MTIEWRDIPGYEGIYRASSDGTILSCARKAPSNGGWRAVRQRELKPIVGKTYYNIGLNRDGELEMNSVGFWVLLAFTGSVKGQAAHIDGDCSNNRIGNLVWKDRSSIEEMKIARGSVPVGDADTRHKLTNQQVMEIRTSNTNCAETGIEFEVCRETIRDVRNGKARRHG